MFESNYDCCACIEDFGVRHPMVAIHAGPTIDLPTAEDATTYVCPYHDEPDPSLTIASLDPHGVMKC